jgi:hypothetical protein
MKLLPEILEKVEKAVATILLKELSTDRVGWVMDDVCHILYSYAQNDIEALYEEKLEVMKKELKYVVNMAESMIESELSGTRYYEEEMQKLMRAKELVEED